MLRWDKSEAQIRRHTRQRSLLSRLLPKFSRDFLVLESIFAKIINEDLISSYYTVRRSVVIRLLGDQ